MTSNTLPRGSTPFLEAVDVRKGYRVHTAWTRFASITAVEGVSVRAWEGKTLAIAGESGCGKSTLGRLLLGLVWPEGGEIRFAGYPLAALRESNWLDFRRSVQMVFQNPLASFNPMLTVAGTISDAMRLRNDLPSRASKKEEAERLASQIGLEASLLKRYPSEMSAGQLQKAGIARALATKPRMVFLDEPTSALDASGRRQIVDLLLALQSDVGLGYVLVAHDFHLIGTMAHHIVVMYLGQVVEEGPAAEVLRRPLHPYSRALLAASYVPSARQSKWRIRGEVAQLPAGYQGCRLYRRCPYAVLGCQELQTLVAIRPPHSVRCWRAAEIAGTSNNLERKNDRG